MKPVNHYQSDRDKMRGEHHRGNIVPRKMPTDIIRRDRANVKPTINAPLARSKSQRQGHIVHVKQTSSRYAGIVTNGGIR